MHGGRFRDRGTLRFFPATSPFNPLLQLRSHCILHGLGPGWLVSVFFGIGKTQFCTSSFDLDDLPTRHPGRRMGNFIVGLFACGGLLWLASDSSVGEVIHGYREGQQALYDDVTELPENRWTRVDLIGMASRLLRLAPGDGFYLAMMPLLLILPGWVLFRKS